MTRLEEKIFSLLKPTVEAVGCELWGIEFFSQVKHSILRVYIEHEQGVTLDNCSEVSEQISAVLDVEDPISVQYTLEVSSPGMYRLLFFVEQYKSYCGNKLQVNLVSPVNGRVKYKGVLLGVSPDGFELQAENEIASIPFANVKKSKVILS